MGDVERAAGAPFRKLGMTAVADDEPLTLADLAPFQETGRAWVVTDDAGAPVGYLLADIVDGNAHIEQVSVHPRHARRGFGRALIDTAEAWAEQQHLAALTLTTYAHVPWNAPYYERLGFEVLDEHELTEGLRRVREHEAARGLAAWPRVTMRRRLRSRPGGRPAPATS